MLKYRAQDRVLNLCYQWKNTQQQIEELFLKKFDLKTHKLILKSNSRNTNWLGDPFTQLKSAERNDGKIQHKSHVGALKQILKCIKRPWNIYKYINFLLKT